MNMRGKYDTLSYNTLCFMFIWQRLHNPGLQPDDKASWKLASHWSMLTIFGGSRNINKYAKLFAYFYTRLLIVVCGHRSKERGKKAICFRFRCGKSLFLLPCDATSMPYRWRCRLTKGKCTHLSFGQRADNGSVPLVTDEPREKARTAEIPVAVCPTNCLLFKVYNKNHKHPLFSSSDKTLFCVMGRTHKVLLIKHRYVLKYEMPSHI